MTRFWRLTPAIALTTALVLVVVGALFALYIDRLSTTQRIDNMSVQGRVLASTVTAALQFEDHQAAQEYVDALRTNPQVRAAAVYDARGAIFARYARTQADTLPVTAQASPPVLENNELVVTVPVTQNGGTIGTVYLRAIADSPIQRLQRYGPILLLVIMAAVMVGVLGLAHNELRRANTVLEQQARDLAATNLSLQTQIDERERVEEVLRQAQKMEAIGQLTGGVAHDFNNLLQIILGALERLRRRHKPGDASDAAISDFQRMTDAALQAGQRAAQLTQRMLAFSRRQPLAAKPIDVNRLVGGMSDMLGRTLGETVQLQTVLAGGLWRSFTDENQLENALLNLAVNARDAMPNGGKLTIETANTYLDDAYVTQEADDVSPGQYVMIAVSDTGTGMARDVMNKVFEPFFTTKEVGLGTGLGLSQVYGFVKQSGGHVKIYSEPGEGTTIKLYLPRLLAADDSAARVPEARGTPTSSGNETILVVEDQEDVRNWAVDTLIELGYRVLQAADGPTALAALAGDPSIALLFTDVGLPGGMNGRQLADTARQRHPKLRVLFTTGYARNAIVHHGRLDPGVELLGKPYSATDLAVKLRELLRG